MTDSNEHDMRFFSSSNLVRALVVIAVAVFGSWLTPASARADAPGRLFYEIIVTAPGSKTQGWHGVLYDAAGNPIEAEPGQTVTMPIGEFVTEIGDFVNVPCNAPWDACGMIHRDMAEWMKTHNANVIMDSKPWVYRLYVNAEGTRSELWTGTLLHDGTEIRPGRPADTPMGPFHAADPEAISWPLVGWFPTSWHSYAAAAGPPAPPNR